MIIARCYKTEELEQLFEATKSHPLSLLIQMTAFYGLRRSEVLGIKWDAIDFERNTITIRHTVTEAKKDGKRILAAKDSAKTKSSLRSPAGSRVQGETASAKKAAEGKHEGLRNQL